MKPFQNLDEQLDIIKNNNIIVENDDEVKKFLLHNNYYNVINKYGYLFISNGKYNDGTTFDEITRVLFLDKNLRSLFMTYLTQVEEHTKSIVAYTFSELYPEKQSYFNHNNFAPGKTREVLGLTSKLQNSISRDYRNTTSPIYHYVNRYHHVPLWVLVNSMYFYDTKNFISYMKHQDTIIICSRIEDIHLENHGKSINVKPSELDTILKNFCDTRNACAHNSRLFDMKLRGSYPYVEDIGCPASIGRSRQTIYDTYLYLSILLPKNDFIQFHNTLLSRFKRYSKAIKSIDFNVILNSLGFPNDWHINTDKKEQQ